MAPLFHTGQFAHGFIAIGQVATGFIAIGQVATGVIAIGQVARGVIAIGMVSLGLVAIGMGALGVVHAGGFGLGGRAGFGLIVPLVPLFDRPRRYPTPTSLAALTRPGDQGWLPVQLRTRRGADSTAGPELVHAGTVLAARIADELAAAAAAFATPGGRPAMAHLSVQAGSLVCDRLVELAVPRQRTLAWWLRAAVQLALLTAAAYLFWQVAAVPLGNALWGEHGILR